MALSSLRTGGGGTAFLLRRVLSPRSVSEQNLSSSSSSENKPEIKNSLQLYKHLVRQTQKLPPDAANFYKDSIRRVRMGSRNNTVSFPFFVFVFVIISNILLFHSFIFFCPFFPRATPSTRRRLTLRG